MSATKTEYAAHVARLAAQSAEMHRRAVKCLALGKPQTASVFAVAAFHTAADARYFRLRALGVSMSEAAF
jgi:hypothetical protein